MYKVEEQDLIKIAKFLDRINKAAKTVKLTTTGEKNLKEAQELSKMIKDKYTQIKPQYDQ